MKCPKCKSKNYSFRKSKRGTIWSCKDCGFKRVNKTAEQLLKEDPIKGSLKRQITNIEEKPQKQPKTITANETISYIKSKTKKYKITEKEKGFFQVMEGDERLADIIDRKRWLAIYLKDNNFVVKKVKNKKEMEEVIENFIR